MECLICSEGKTKVLLDFGLQPVCHKFLQSQKEDEKKHTLSLGQCTACGLVQLTDKLPEEELKPIYDWVKYNEPENHLDELTQIIKNLPGLKSDSVIAGISLKDNSLLDRMRKEGFNNVQEINYNEDKNLGVETIQKILNEETAQKIIENQGKFDLIIARHILEHSYNLKSFMKAIRSLLKPKGYIVFEVPDSAQIFDDCDYSSIWEEHITYFTEATFKNSILSSNFSINKLLKFHSSVENILVSIVQNNQSVENICMNKDLLDLEIEKANNFTSKFPEIKQKIKSYFLERRKKISLFGAGHIACSFINIFDLKEDLLCVIDDDPMKQELYMPGSKLSIKNSKFISKNNLDQVVFALNPEIENKIILKFQEFVDDGGSFLSISPISKISLNSIINNDSDIKKFSKICEGAYQIKDEIVKLGVEDIDFLKKNIINTNKKRTRVCAHKNSDDNIHEMFIVLDKDTYVRPHKHIGKSESFHIVEGLANVIVFNDDGTIKEVIEMGDYSSGKRFFYRINNSFYHTVIVKSNKLVLHEVTNGPFDKEDTQFASWSPKEEDVFAQNKYIENLLNSIGLFISKQKTETNDATIDISWWRTKFGEEEIQKIKESISQEHISQGCITEQFEKKIAEALNVPYAVVTTSGSVALLMAMMSFGIGPGDEVIVPNRTWIATANAPLMLGAKVVPVDVLPDTPVMDISQIIKKITPKTKAILPVHLNGRSVDMEGIQKIAKEYGLFVIEDACQAMFSKNSKGFLGTQSDIGCFSLGISKLISTGQGGILVTKSKKTYEKLKLIRNHGTVGNINPVFKLKGFNFKFTDILASVGLVQLSKAKEKINKLNEIYAKYFESIKSLSYIKIIPVNVFGGEVPLYVEIMCNERSKLIDFLKSNGINIRPSLPDISSTHYLKNYDEFPNSKIFCERALFLPCGPGQSFENIDRVLKALRSFGEKYK